MCEARDTARRNATRRAHGNRKISRVSVGRAISPYYRTRDHPDLVSRVARPSSILEPALVILRATNSSRYFTIRSRAHYPPAGVCLRFSRGWESLLAGLVVVPDVRRRRSLPYERRLMHDGIFSAMVGPQTRVTSTFSFGSSTRQLGNKRLKRSIRLYHVPN